MAAPASIFSCILASFLSWISARAEVTASSEIASASAGAAAASSSLSFLAFSLISAKSFWRVPLDYDSSVLPSANSSRGDFSDFSDFFVFEIDFVSARVAFFFFSSASLAAAF